MKRVYLDYAATTPVRAEVLEEMLPYFSEDFGNPSSIHSYGQEAKSAVDESREKVAELIGAHSDEIVFTSGGTEADNFAIKGAYYARQKKGNHIITSKIEHHAVLESCKFLEKRGAKVTYLAVDKDGLVDPDSVRDAITDDTILISIMHANNEIGTIEPISEISKIAQERDVYFHTDAVQTAGHIPLTVEELGVDMLSMSSHKLCGPKGIGALYIKKGTRITPFLHGGEQERSRRASTENVSGIVGFGKAAELAKSDLETEVPRLNSLRTKLIEGLSANIDNIIFNGHPTSHLPGTVNVGIEFVEGESMLLNLDLAGICASTGSACSSGSLEPSHVLLALGIPHMKAHGSLRFSLGLFTVEEDIERVFAELPPIVKRLRAMSPLLKSH